MPTPDAQEARIKSYLDSDDFYRYVYVICNKYLIGLPVGRNEAVEDAVLDVLVKAWIGRHTFRPSPLPETDSQWRDAFRRWIAQIARNHCISKIREQKHGEVLNGDQEIPEQGSDPTGPITDNIALLACLRHLRAMDSAAYEALVLKHLKSMTWEKVAQELDISISQARTLEKNAVRQMRTCLGGSDFLEDQGS